MPRHLCTRWGHVPRYLCARLCARRSLWCSAFGARHCGARRSALGAWPGRCSALGPGPPTVGTCGASRLALSTLVLLGRSPHRMRMGFGNLPRWFRGIVREESLVKNEAQEMSTNCSTNIWAHFSGGRHIRPKGARGFVTVLVKMGLLQHVLFDANNAQLVRIPETVVATHIVTARVSVATTARQDSHSVPIANATLLQWRRIIWCVPRS